MIKMGLGGKGATAIQQIQALLKKLNQTNVDVGDNGGQLAENENFYRYFNMYLLNFTPLPSQVYTYNTTWTGIYVAFKGVFSTYVGKAVSGAVHDFVENSNKSPYNDYQSMPLNSLVSENLQLVFEESACKSLEDLRYNIQIIGFTRAASKSYPAMYEKMHYTDVVFGSTTHTTKEEFEDAARGLPSITWNDMNINSQIGWHHATGGFLSNANNNWDNVINRGATNFLEFLINFYCNGDPSAYTFIYQPPRTN